MCILKSSCPPKSSSEAPFDSVFLGRYNTDAGFLGWRGFMVIKSQSNLETAMKVRVVGAGSIGSRYLQELSALRQDETFYWVIHAVGKAATAFAEPANSGSQFTGTAVPTRRMIAEEDLG